MSGSGLADGDSAWTLLIIPLFRRWRLAVDEASNTIALRQHRLSSRTSRTGQGGMERVKGDDELVPHPVNETLWPLRVHALASSGGRRVVGAVEVLQAREEAGGWLVGI